ncbi:transcriptional regulator, NifA, Fis Family [Thermodesulfobacterium geofontis OPF15]|jgi:Nif-specific regulatory protein|uniref:Nif-specific regulatory protein n=1 Tax=Thermodesulfobacterium geofontis (strain OPF15) TaxID=795359 RepID=F8C281_THEGP|nr:nif-specific transcriptional activator NifA [Thermodesulfobacterium geofontis]AEH23339.1 transcriptional regulator, NifA, Fis Family [Thermodesulfobacterium geofontis OPF15]
MNALERKNAELTALLEISKILSSSFELEENIYRALKVLSDSLHMTRGTVTLLDPETSELRIAVAYGLTREQIARGKYKIGEGIVGKVVETGSPIVVPDIGKEPLFLNRTRARINKDNISFLCVPIKINEEILGVLSVDKIFDKSIDFEEDLRVLNIVATLIGQAIKLYRRFSEEKLKREELTLELRNRFSIQNIITVSDRMHEVIKTVIKVSKSKATVLLRGESGTGKELIAKAIHFESPRAKGPFIAVNCAAIPETLLEAELFGYERGAFTGAVTAKPGKFELANGGTLFLDEIGETSPALQAKLLRVIQEYTFERLGGTKSINVDVRIIAATNKDLEDMVKKGLFREDLYWRLNVVSIFLPPLRERKEDIPLLIEHFLKRFNKEYGRRISISSQAMEKLIRYSWPGNVRELENTIERLVILAEKEEITVEDLPIHIRSEMLKTLNPSNTYSLKKEIEELEKRRIEEALKKCDYNQARAARLLGITQRQIGYKIKKYKILIPSFRAFASLQVGNIK